MTEKRLEDVFAGYVELTASERSYVQFALGEAYAQGGFLYKGENHREIANRVTEKLLGPLKLTHLVAPDGMCLVSIDEYDAVVRAFMKENP